MKNWTPIETSLFILTLTVPLMLTFSMILRLVGAPASIEAAALLEDLLKFIVGGVLGIIGASYKRDNG